MTAATLITLRETLEASLVVGIILAYLQRMQVRQSTYVWSGVLAGVSVSLIVAIIFETLLGGFEGPAEALYEGITMLTGAALMTWMILWMFKQRHGMRRDIERSVDGHIENENPWGLFALALVSTAREGTETVIFLNAAIIHAGGMWSLIGGFSGIAAAMILSYLLFRGIIIVKLQTFFAVTNLLLILFAAGLVAHGMHELAEIGIVPELMEEVWNVNPPLVGDMYPLLHENGAVGTLLKGLFGYNGNPTLMEVLAYIAYLGGIGIVWRRSARS